MQGVVGDTPVATVEAPRRRPQVWLLRRAARRLSLRARLTLISAVIVAIAVAAVAGAAYVVVSRQLTNQEDASLQTQFQRTQTPFGMQSLLTRGFGDTGVVQDFTFEVIDANGKPLAIQGSQPIGSPAAYVKVATGAVSSLSGDGYIVNGPHVRIFAFRGQVQTTGQPVAVLIERNISGDDETLSHLKLFLFVAGGLGVLLAALGGLVVARSGLRPVDRLTEAAEHIAKTEELDVPIEVTGHDEVARLARAFNAMTAALASSRVRQQQLVADAGHELRTPLTSMRTNLDLLIRSEKTGRVLPAEDRERLLEDLAAQMSELGTLVAELVNLARDDRAIEPDVDVDFAEVVNRAAERARLRAGDAQLVEVYTSAWPVHGRPGELERAVVNLMDNAVKFSPPGEPVVVQLTEGTLTVADRGPGINADDLPHVFDRFYRSTSARGMPGSGLGLAIVAQTVQAHGGTVTLAANPGGGTVATLDLPAAAPTDDPHGSGTPGAVPLVDAVDSSPAGADSEVWQRPSVSH